MTTKKEGLSLPEQQGLEPTIEYYIDNPVIPMCAGIALVKDLEHRFVASNGIFSQFSGVSPQKLQGLRDDDMPWAEQRDIYISHEKAILSGETYKVIEPLLGHSKSLIHTAKKIIYDSTGRPAGTFAMALLLDVAVEFNTLVSASRIKRIMNYGHYKLAPMEMKLLYFFLQGFSRGTISTLLNVSTSTYDSYIRNIKITFGVSSIVELKEKCISLGYHEVHPFQLLM
ncbi:MAG: helix-turn-helix transcriptional regulator [Serratia sp. (in: enterobacteria)]|uniref:helix-turn-helix transcriptional regulator n=1 Tax=Serratia sp. (in: enterobacteria) TaxID=616 RepID=UPI003F2FCA52